jgi:phospholipid/cholesterol/gamma-HCH transport system ATP-binding protein
MTVKENLEFPVCRSNKSVSKKQIDKMIDEVLEAVGLLSAKGQMPSELSGGQRKRIGIARTLIINEVQERYHTSSIIITHDLTCAKVTGDKVAMLLDGHFVKKGSFEEIFGAEDSRIQSFYDYNFIQ